MLFSKRQSVKKDKSSFFLGMAEEPYARELFKSKAQDNYTKPGLQAEKNELKTNTKII